MKKNSREQYLTTWLTYLKGKNQIDPKALGDFLGKTLKGALAPITMKRYTATVIGNLYENGFLAGKTGKTFSGEPLEIRQEITLPVLDKCLTQNYKKVKFTDLDQSGEPVEPVAEPQAGKKPRKAGGKKKVEKTGVAVEKPLKKPAKKGPARKQAKETIKPLDKKAIGRKPGPKKKKVAEKPRKAIIVKAKRAPGKTPGRKPAAQKPGLIGRKTDLLNMGEGAFLYALELSQRVEDLEREIANYERMFQAVRQLFSREMEEIEDLVTGLLE
jgi:hypothetical protein